MHTAKNVFRGTEAIREFLDPGNLPYLPLVEIPAALIERFDLLFPVRDPLGGGGAILLQSRHFTFVCTRPLGDDLERPTAAGTGGTTLFAALTRLHQVLLLGFEGLFLLGEHRRADSDQVLIYQFR